MRYRVGGERHTEWCMNTEDAEVRLAEIETDVRRGTWKSPAQQRKTVSEVADEWLASKKQTPTTIARDRGVLDHWWLPAIGKRPVASIIRTDLQRVVDGMVASGLGGSTTVTYSGVITAVLNFAVDEGYIARAPVKRLRLPEREPVEHAEASVATLLALIHELPARYRLLPWLLGVCGLRWSEAIALRVGDIDVDAKVVHLRRKIVEVEGVFHEDRVLKTKGSVGRVSLPSVVLQAYREHLLVTSARGKHEMLFTSPRGGTLRASNFRQRVWKPATRRAGAEGYTARELRQISSAIVREAGGTEHEAKVHLRHTHQPTTSDVYGGVTVERHEALDQAISALFATRWVNGGSDVVRGDMA